MPSAAQREIINRLVAGLPTMRKRRGKGKTPRQIKLDLAREEKIRAEEARIAQQEARLAAEEAAKQLRRKQESEKRLDKRLAVLQRNAEMTAFKALRQAPKAYVPPPPKKVEQKLTAVEYPGGEVRMEPGVIPPLEKKKAYSTFNILESLRGEFMNDFYGFRRQRARTQQQEYHDKVVKGLLAEDFSTYPEEELRRELDVIKDNPELAEVTDKLIDEIRLRELNAFKSQRRQARHEEALSRVKLSKPNLPQYEPLAEPPPPPPPPPPPRREIPPPVELEADVKNIPFVVPEFKLGEGRRRGGHIRRFLSPAYF